MLSFVEVFEFLWRDRGVFNGEEFDLNAEFEDDDVVDEEQRGSSERVKVNALVGDSAEEGVTDDDVVSSEGDFTIVLKGENLTEDGERVHRNECFLACSSLA